jgi:hypothetical protein
VGARHPGAWLERRPQIAHLAWTDHSALLAATDTDAFHVLVEKALVSPGSFVDDGAEEDRYAGTYLGKRELRAGRQPPPPGLRRPEGVPDLQPLQPWRTETFKISADPLLIDKIRDVVGLYLAPPANTAVFAVDEKPQIQALERTAPVLPMVPGTPERRSFDYVRHGTVDLFAALNTATGKVIGKLSAQHRGRLP